jgi:hypothetical protein
MPIRNLCKDTEYFTAIIVDTKAFSIFKKIMITSSYIEQEKTPAGKKSLFLPCVHLHDTKTDYELKVIGIQVPTTESLYPVSALSKIASLLQQKQDCVDILAIGDFGSPPQRTTNAFSSFNRAHVEVLRPSYPTYVTSFGEASCHDHAIVISENSSSYSLKGKEALLQSSRELIQTIEFCRKLFLLLQQQQQKALLQQQLYFLAFPPVNDNQNSSSGQNHRAS